MSSASTLVPAPATSVTRAPRRRVRPEAVAGVAILAGLAAAFILIPALSSTSSSQISALPLTAPSAQHPFGTDQLGRDVFVRAFEAGRVDLGVILVSITLAAVGGTIVGLLASYLPASARAVVVRITDAVMALPYIVLVIGLAASLGHRQIVPGLPRGVAATCIAVVIACWPAYTRLTLSRALVLRTRDSVVAARVLGYGPLRILFGHIAPSVVSTSLSYAATQAVATTALVGSLAFLGAGVAPPTAELGQMMSDTIALLPVAWWAPIFPGLVVLALGIGFALLADSAGRRSESR